MMKLLRAHLKRSAGRAALLLGVCTGTGVYGQPSPAPMWPWVNLRLDVAEPAFHCPQPEEVVTWVNALVGREFVTAEAPTQLTLRVEPGPNGELVVTVIASEPNTSTSQTELRRFQRVATCSELLHAAALTVSLFAKNPVPEQGPSSPELSPTSPPPPEPLTTEPPPNAGTIPGVNPRSSEDTKAGSSEAPTPQASTPVLPIAPAASQPPIAPSDSQSSNVIPPQTLPLAEPKPISVEANTPEADDHATAWQLEPIAGLSGDLALGLNPGVGLGASIHVGLQWRDWELLLRGVYLAGTGKRLIPTELGTILGPTLELGVAACPVLEGPLLTAGATTVRLCGIAGPLWVYARGKGFAHDRTKTLATFAVGASAELLLNINSSISFTSRVEVTAPFTPVTYQLEGESSASWAMWPVAPRLALGFEWR